MRRVIQPNTWSCLAACAVMITGEDLSDLYRDVGHDGSEMPHDSPYQDGRRGFRLPEVARYLAGHGFLVGAPAHVLSPMFPPVMLHTLPALLIVKGPSYPAMTHAVIWTGEAVLDPSAQAPDRALLSDYSVLQWWPIVYIRQENFT